MVETDGGFIMTRYRSSTFAALSKSVSLVCTEMDVLKAAGNISIHNGLTTAKQNIIMGTSAFKHMRLAFLA
jgi:hypothetical protein